MQISDRQPAEVREILETQDREELRRAAHKIAWMRMNGSINAANADPSRFASGNGRSENEPSRHR
jgi:hypothetical protein